MNGANGTQPLDQQRHARALLLLVSGAFVTAFIAIGVSSSVDFLNASSKSSLNLNFPEEFYWNLSTEERYRTDEGDFYGKYAQIRRHLDYDYHARYSEERVLFQDSIIDALLENGGFESNNCSVPQRPWIVFTAGAMGAGKSHTIRVLGKKGRFPIHSFTFVDPDAIRYRLPEFQTFIEHNPNYAGELTRKEAGMIAEILAEAALQRGHNVLVDGTLRDATWYRQYFHVLRHSHPSLRIAILHITAPREDVFQHALVSRFNLSRP
jgi:predicted kinase